MRQLMFGKITIMYTIVRGQVAFFGDGSGTEKGFDYLTKGLDVAAHEFTHGVIDSLSPLTYSGESGALNEHIADFWCNG